jgi:mRNA-degrading endonuclease RelE of RelBE toxin-antitoxin system
VPYSVEFTPEAAQQLRALRARDMARIADQCQRMLSVNPTLESKARIKRLSGNVFPPYRLRVDDFRVFYDVEEEIARVTIYGVISKAEANEWLIDFQGTFHEDENAQ